MTSSSGKAQAVVAELSAHYASLKLVKGDGGTSFSRLACGVKAVDDLLEGGLPFGGVTEFGVPLGKEGRALVLKFLAGATRGGPDLAPLWTLWISAPGDFQVFPPACFVRGVLPSRMVFTCSDVPLRDLKRVFIHPLFRLIVLDAPPRFSREDGFFLDHQARLNHQLVLLLRNFFLSNRQGNIWAKRRLNCWKRHGSGQFVIRVIRGLSYRQLILDEGALS